LGGIVILLFLYLEIDRIIVRGLIFALVFFVFVLANNMGAAFYLLVALLLVFIIAKLTSRYRERKARSLLLVGCGLSGVLLGEVFFAAVAIHPLLYVFATLMTFLGYVLVLFQVRR
jgi:glucose-6-phosphate-specific signal transduction histidine kinase